MVIVYERVIVAQDIYIETTVILIYFIFSPFSCVVNMSKTFTLSQRNSCVFQPRNPKTGLPTTLLERKSINILHDADRTDSIVINHEVINQTNNMIKERTSSDRKLLKKKTIKTKNLAKRNSSINNRPATAPALQSSKTSKQEFVDKIIYKSPDANELKKLIDNDKQFFAHLQMLKQENKKTLQQLDRLYDTSLNGGQSRNRSVQQWLNNDTQSHADSLENEIRKGEEVSSEDELDELLRVKAPTDHVNILPDGWPQLRGRSSSYDVIANMWENFSVDEYAPYTRTQKIECDKKKWSPSVTIPAPFQMTVREERKCKVKSKRVEEIEAELLQKRLQEECELQKRIVPTPVPATTFLPLYEEIKEQQEKKRQYVRQLTKEILKSTEKPFSFIKREQAKKELKRSCSVGSLQKKDKNKKFFQARPYPEKLFDYTFDDKMAEQEEYRKIKIKLRAQEMLAKSSLPPNMKTRGSLRHYPSGEKTRKVREELRERKKVQRELPDFRSLQEKFSNELQAKKNVNTATVCDPFELQTTKITDRRSKFRKSIEQRQTEESERKKPPHSVENSRRSAAVASPAYSINEVTRLRQERLRASLEKSRLEELRKSIDDTKKRKEQERMRKNLTKKVMAQDPARNRRQESEEKLKSFREADFFRRREYQDYLKDMNDKVNGRPLLFERESQTNAKLKVQRRYEEILREAGFEGNALDSMIQLSYAEGTLKNSFEGDDSESNIDDGDEKSDSYEDKSDTHGDNIEESFEDNKEDDGDAESCGGDLLDDGDDINETYSAEHGNETDDGSYIGT